jgi:hypothetical protein
LRRTQPTLGPAAWLALLAAAAAVLAQETPLPGTPSPADPAMPPFASHVRVSALIKSGDEVRVGLTDAERNLSRLVAVGDTFSGVTVVSADYAKEEVVLRKGQQTATLKLKGVPGVPIESLPAAGIAEGWRGEGIEEYLRAHSNAVIKTGLSFDELRAKLGDQPQGKSIQDYLKEDPALAEKLSKPAVGLGEGIESYLREHPELRAQIEQPQTGRGSGIEGYLKEHPELREQLDRPVEGLGPGIEAARRELERSQGQAASNALAPTPLNAEDSEPDEPAAGGE